MSEKKNILVIDDEEILLQIITDILSEFGYSVLTSTNGPEGIRMFRENAGSIALVILDMSLPGMSGMSVFGELRVIDPLIKVLFSSGAGTMDKLPDPTGVSFIPKPFSVMELADRVREMVS